MLLASIARCFCVEKCTRRHARWLFREFNELPHFFEERINLSYESADKYDKQFATPLLSILARCVSYVTGGVVAIFAIMALIDDRILLQVGLRCFCVHVLAWKLCVCTDASVSVCLCVCVSVCVFASMVVADVVLVVLGWKTEQSVDALAWVVCVSRHSGPDMPRRFGEFVG